ncbi:MAG: type II toxin-antitoxin system RelE/ParE family toxin [Acidobacteriota bacterium]|nr:type II toxin-antitoxin system RelE/ParE family toxin [Acidobacteriota bacterium]
MRFEIIFAPEPAEIMRRLDTHVRAAVRDDVELHLRHEPTKVSKSRSKRLRGLRQPQYRLRVGQIRVFYEVVGNEVHVLAIIEKARAATWLIEQGTPE